MKILNLKLQFQAINLNQEFTNILSKKKKFHYTLNIKLTKIILEKIDILKDNNLNLEEVAFFGSSHVFGWGLDDNETLPYLFKNKTLIIMFILGINGGAINQTLHLINKKPDFLKKNNIIVTGPYQLEEFLVIGIILLMFNF